MTKSYLADWASLIPRGMRAVDTWQRDEPPPLHPEEELSVQGVGSLRRGEFAAGRWCARRAIERLGFPERPIFRRSDGVASWPPEVVGSITHSHGYVAAAVGLSHQVCAVGIDAEPHRVVNKHVTARIATAEESRHMSDMSRAVPEIHWDRVLFSAKEAAYKAWYPLKGTPLRFRDINVTFQADGQLQARIEPNTAEDHSPFNWTGRWTCSDFVLTAVVVPAHSYGVSDDSAAR